MQIKITATNVHLVDENGSGIEIDAEARDELAAEIEDSLNGQTITLLSKGTVRITGTEVEIELIED